MIIVQWSSFIISIKFKVYWQTIGNHLPLAINIYMYTWDNAIFCKLTKRNCEENEKKAQINKTQKYNISEHQIHKIANK